MQPFEYATATKKEQVATLLTEQSAILAGGTDLLALMKDDIVTPRRLVNVKPIEGLRGITYQSGAGLRIGALTTIAELAEDANVRQDYSMLAEAAIEAASVQIRNLATLGGNMCQRPRDWYFRNGMGLLAMKDGKSLIREGDNRYAAILGNDGPALFVSPSTIAPVLIAYGAKIRLYSAKASGTGVRELPLEKFFVIPTKEGELEHDLKPDEMVIELIVPPPSKNLKTSSYEVRQRAAFDWPLAHAAVALEMDGSTVKSARVVLGQVAPVPWISSEAEQALVGKSITPDIALAAANAAVAKAKPLSRNKYKITLTKAAVKRAVLNAAAGRIGGVA
ncbi:MAG TPA: FAD binding domain-containing protein [Candidatus Eisenbacteria bacterium]|nr:FAD binding domain-containing protein [Candidatus Eisenbacteria bacterium]